MMKEIAKMHMRALPHTGSSKRGVEYLTTLYKLVEMLGFVKVVKRNGKVVGAISGIGRLILTLVVDPEWQRKGIGRELLEGLSGRRYVYTEECTRVFYEKLWFRQILKIGKTVFLWRR